MLHRQDWFQGCKEKLYEQSWHPDRKDVPPICTLILVHGLAEHSGRYLRQAKELVQHRIEVFAYDQIGHGQSGGERAFMHRFDDLVTDLETFVSRVQHRNQGRPVFIMGHSMGGAVVAKFLMTRRPQDIRGWIFSSAALKISDSVSGLLRAVAPVIGALMPRLSTQKLPAHLISRDEAEVAAYVNDPLNYVGGTRARTGSEILKACQFFEAHFHEVVAPLLIFHGTADELTDPEGSRRFYERAASLDKTFIPYEGYYHETMNDLGREAVLQNLIQWITERTLTLYFDG